MAKLAIFMADGCEEIEALTVVDIIRRAKMEIDTISITDSKEVTSSHKVTFRTDLTKAEADFTQYDGVVLPGGMPGTLNLGADGTVNAVITEYAEAGKLVSAICAAPSVLGQAGLLDGKKATSYPGFADKMTGCTYLEEPVVRDDNIITSRGMGTAIAFGLAIVEYFTDGETAKKLGGSFMYRVND